MTPVTTLSALTRCPVCGEARYDNRAILPFNTSAAMFECGSIFFAGRNSVIVSTPCPVPSRIQADALNREPEKTSNGD